MNEIEYEEFYLKYRQIAKSYAYGILEDWYLADDISQEVLYKMYTIRNDLDLEKLKNAICADPESCCKQSSGL